MTAPKLLVTLFVLFVLSGCLQMAGAAGSPDTPTLGGDAAGPAPGAGDPGAVSAPADDATPTPPDELTAASAGDYVAALETNYREVRILREATVDVTAVDVRCTPASATPAGEGYEVVVECGFSYEFQTDGTVGIADGVPYSATYVVSEGSVQRLGEDPALP